MTEVQTKWYDIWYTWAIIGLLLFCIGCLTCAESGEESVIDPNARPTTVVNQSDFSKNRLRFSSKVTKEENKAGSAIGAVLILIGLGSVALGFFMKD